MRRLGLDVVQAHLAEGKTLPEEMSAEVRKLLADAEPAVRAVAVRTVAAFRNAADAERFTQMLSAESREQVRQALINGLGYVGTATSTSPLLALRFGAWRDPDKRFRSERGSAVDRALLREGDDELHLATGVGLAFDTFQLDLALDVSDVVTTLALSAIYTF